MRKYISLINQYLISDGTPFWHIIIVSFSAAAFMVFLIITATQAVMFLTSFITSSNIIVIGGVLGLIYLVLMYNVIKSIIKFRNNK